MKLKVIIMSLMALTLCFLAAIAIAAPIKDSDSSSVDEFTNALHNKLFRTPYTLVIPSNDIPLDTYATNAERASIFSRDTEVDHSTCVDVFAGSHHDGIGAYDICVPEGLCGITRNPNTLKQTMRIGSLRMPGNTECTVFSNDNCNPTGAHERISAKNMLSNQPAIPEHAWRGSFQCWRLDHFKTHDDNSNVLEARQLAGTDLKTREGIVNVIDALQLIGNGLETGDSGIKPLDSRQFTGTGLETCVDVFEGPDFNGAAMYNQCVPEWQCTSVADQLKARTLLYLGSIRVTGSTVCVVFESDNCDPNTVRETITTKNMLSWPPAIPQGSYRASFRCLRPN
jgi:hypothetical protein